MAVLNKGDFEDLQMISNLSEGIYEEYLELYNLEVAGKKETEEYRGHLKHLKSLIGFERNIKERVFTSFEKIGEAINYYRQKLGIDTPKSDSPELLVLSKYGSIPQTQKEVAFIRNYNGCTDACVEFFNKSDSESYEEDPDKKAMRDSYVYSANFFNALDLNKVKLCIAIMGDISGKNALRLKYILSVCSPNLESELIDNNFNLDRGNITLNEPFEIPGMPKIKLTADIMQNVGFDSWLNELRYFDNFALADESQVLDFNYSIAIIRAHIALLDDEEALVLLRKVASIIDQMKDDPKYSICCRNLETIFEKRKEDRAIVVGGLHL